MDGNRAKSANHRVLVDANVIWDDAKLTPEEDSVIKNLSQSELQTLVGIRKKLAAVDRDIINGSGRVYSAELVANFCV